jgi:hypothetical protein
MSENKAVRSANGAFALIDDALDAFGDFSASLEMLAAVLMAR